MAWLTADFPFPSQQNSPPMPIARKVDMPDTMNGIIPDGRNQHGIAAKRAGINEDSWPAGEVAPATPMTPGRFLRQPLDFLPRLP